MFRVVFYQKENGSSPVSDFLDELSDQARVKVIRQLKYLENFGLTLANPNLKKLSGTNLWEVRILGRDSIRIVCVAIVKGEIVVLHIFKKKSNKTTLKDLNLAIKRYKDLTNDI